MKYDIIEETNSGTYLVESQTTEGAFYKVENSEGDWTCTCLSFNRRTDLCKHIRFMKQAR